MQTAMAKIRVENLYFYYGDKPALANISIGVQDRQITALIGPSGCGKSTFLRCLNRMNDTIPGTRVEGRVLLDGQDIYALGTDVVGLRQRVGMVFQRPNPFPQSIFDNVAFGPRVLGLHKNDNLADIVEESLRAAVLWDEVKDNLRQDALSLSMGQQQRLCIARALANHPRLILADEPTGELDSRTGREILSLFRQIVALENTALIVATHDQAIYDFATVVYELEDGQLTCHSERKARHSERKACHSERSEESHSPP